MIIGFDASRAGVEKKTGVEWYAYHLINGLKLIDQENQYFLYTPKKLNNDLYPLPKNFHAKILNWPFKKFWSLGRLNWEILINKPDLLFIPSYTLPKYLGKKTIITWHDLAYEYFPQYYNKIDLLNLKLSGKRLNQADLIITISEFSKAELMKFYGLPREKIAVVYLGYDHLNYNPDKIPKPSLQKYKISKPYLLYIGRLELKKNIINLIKAFNILKNNKQLDYQLVLIGKPGYQAVKILAEINSSPYKNDIIFLNWLMENEKKIILKQAKVFVFPSHYEGFGLPIIEALSLGIPVAASNLPVFKELVGEVIIYFDQNKYQDIANKIYHLINNSDLQNSNINKGQLMVKKYTWENCCQNTLKIINSLNIDKK